MLTDEASVDEEGELLDNLSSRQLPVAKSLLKTQKRKRTNLNRTSVTPKPNPTQRNQKEAFVEAEWIEGDLISSPDFFSNSSYETYV